MLKSSFGAKDFALGTALFVVVVEVERGFFFAGEAIRFSFPWPRLVVVVDAGTA